jgi:hypothetical protein
MTKLLGIIFTLALLALAAWVLMFHGDGISIVIDGQPVTGPMKGAIGVGGIVVAFVALFCAAIVLAFVFAGIGALVVGILVLVGLVVALIIFPFMLPLLIPLFIVWLFIAIVRGSKPSA